MNKRKNLLSALLYQITHLIYGLVVPRLILGSFGSELNGMVSSITQFLSFISLLEGGLGAVVLAELYTPIEENDDNRIKGILYSCQKFFSKLAVFFVVYTLILAAVYSYSVRNDYEISFTITLVFILSLTTLAQYLFSITFKLYLQANQEIYITNLITTGTLVVNTIIAFLVIKLFPEIHILKLLSSIAFFVQPLIYRRFIPAKYTAYKDNKNTGVILKNRWSGFAQNLAHYVNMNTDIVLITLFCSFTDVSVYSVYLLGINAIRSVVSYVTNSYQSALGKYIAQGDKRRLNENFKVFCVYTWATSLILYCTCILLINPFVSIYTNNVNDANYYQPIFALIIIMANMMYCLREPYRLLILAGGKFRETNFGSIMEAVLNLGISIILIRPLRLTGVAIGTLVAISYRMVYFIAFLKKGMLDIHFKEYSRYVITGIFIIVLNIIIYFNVNLKIDSFMSFFIWGSGILILEGILVGVLFLSLTEFRRMMMKLLMK